MMKLLILGAKGMLGHELAAAFPAPDYELTLWDREEMDITDAADVERKVAALRPEVIINAAAYTAVDRAESEEELCTRINATAVGYLARAAQANGALLVHFSTDYVFDGQRPEGYPEDYPVREPNTAYGRSKKKAEELLAELGSRYYLIRTQWLFGKSGKNFIETMLHLAAEGKDLRVVNDQFGSPTYARDLAQRVRQMIEEKRASGVYHVTNSGTCTWYEFAQEIFRQSGLRPVVAPVDSKEFAAPAKRPTYSMLINTKLPPLRSWQEALDAYLVETGRIDE